MTKDTVSIGEVIGILNGMLDLDPEATTALISHRVPCNEKMSEHPTIQVLRVNMGCRVGVLGLLNGLFGVYDDLSGPIGAVWQYDDGKEPQLMRFCKMSAPKK